jgi:hypothetical protein
MCMYCRDPSQTWRTRPAIYTILENESSSSNKLGITYARIVLVYHNTQLVVLIILIYAASMTHKIFNYLGIFGYQSKAYNPFFRSSYMYRTKTIGTKWPTGVWLFKKKLRYKHSGPCSSMKCKRLNKRRQNIRNGYA